MRMIAAIVVLAGVANSVEAQPSASAALDTPKFEVASIKLCKGGDVAAGKQGGGGRIRWDPQRLTEECQPLDNLIRDAYLTWRIPKARPGRPPLAKKRPRRCVASRMLVAPVAGEGWHHFPGEVCARKFRALRDGSIRRGTPSMRRRRIRQLQR